MIKNFSNSDEDDSLITEQHVGEKPPVENEFEEFAAPFFKIEDETDLLEIPELEAGDSNVLGNTKTAAESVNTETADEMAAVAEDLNQPLLSEIENEAARFETSAVKSVQTPPDDYEIFSQSAYHTESSDETIRKSSLAYSAAIILFGSIVFTLILGWFADLLFGTAPWGKVGGIILGAIIGFIQFFRTTSQILKDSDREQ